MVENFSVNILVANGDQHYSLARIAKSDESIMPLLKATNKLFRKLLLAFSERLIYCYDLRFRRKTPALYAIMLIAARDAGKNAIKSNH